MKKLITLATLSLALSGFALADDRGDFSWVEPSTSSSYDGQSLSRADHPQPVPSSSGDGALVSIEAATDRAGV